MAKNNKTTENQDFSKYIRWFWWTFTGGILFIILIFLLIGLFAEMPDHTVLENPKTNLATEIISSDGKTLGKFYFNDNRTPVSYEDLPQNLIDALIATEDARFHSHSGIDAIGTLRALVKLGSGGGASTISQQLAKQLFHGEGSKNIIERMLQKVKDINEDTDFSTLFNILNPEHAVQFTGSSFTDKMLNDVLFYNKNFFIKISLGNST